MVREFQDAISEVLDSTVFAQFKKDNPSYYLAHGFTQLDKEYTQLKKWQIGFYSKEKDNLAVFETEPTNMLPFEDAFKDGGVIDELQNPHELISTDEAIKIKKKILEDKHTHEIPNSFLFIVQMINGVPVFNITAITMAFSMISTHINAHTGEIIKENKSSVLNLSKQ